MTTCKHCLRPIALEYGAWVDPEATGDDLVWRLMCDRHDTFVAEHEPAAPVAVTTWANGFGVWHARVPRNAGFPLIAARRAIRDELLARVKDCRRDVWMYPVRVLELDEAETLVYRERGEGDPAVGS